MACKSILLHLSNERRVARLIEAAKLLALPAGAHLTGLFANSYSAARRDTFCSERPFPF